MKISLNINNDLEILDHKLKVKISKESGNTLQIKDDGLYAQALSGQNGSNGTGYGSQDKNGIRIGYTNIFNPDKITDTERGTLCHVTNVLHRFYKLNAPYGGEPIINSPQYQRGNCDIILAGDMLYYDNPTTNKRDVWLVTQVKYSPNISSNGTDINEEELHNTEIVSTVKILSEVSI